MIDIRKALAEAIGQMSNDHAQLESEILLSHVLNKNRAYLYTHPELLLDPNQMERYQQLISQRTQGIPIAYLTGHREFWSLDLKVSPSTLIPRHETELLVELTLELLPKKEYMNVLELGTGSGAIALALAVERPHWNILACDISEEALHIAKENAKNLGMTHISFYHSDWFKNIPQLQYDAIISNPPYISPNDPHLNHGDLRFEPQNALVSGQDGLADLQYIVQNSYNYLAPNGLLLVEHGYDQKSYLGTILNKLGYNKIHCWKDIQGHDRVSAGWKSGTVAESI
jgi:release factor glutamine methyltransferase